MKINNIILHNDLKVNRDIKRLQNSMMKKIEVIDFDPNNIRKSEYFIHDFFLVDSLLFIVYKYQQFRVLLMVDSNNQNLIIIKIHFKSKNHEKYYCEFRKFAKKLVS